MISSVELASGSPKPTDQRVNLRRQSLSLESNKTLDQDVAQRIAAAREATISFIDNDCFGEVDPLSTPAETELVNSVEQGQALAGELSPSMPAHLARLCNTPLLTPAEEQDLFRRMNHHKRHADEQRKSLRRSRRKLEAFEESHRRSERLRNYLVQANTRLVMSIARSFADNRNAFDDLLSQGISSLMHAVEKFDFGRGYRFSTYATCAIRRDLYRMVMGTKKDGQRYTTGTSEMLSACTDYRSEDEGISVGAWNSLSKTVGAMLDQLDDRERLIVAARFGFGDEQGKTSYSTLGTRLGISKERVRQLANRALEKLKGLAEEQRLESLIA